MSATLQSGDNRLAVLAVDIRQAHADIRANAEAMAERALAVGEMLIEAKAALPHGAWGNWLTQNVGMSPRTARLYMQMSRSGLKTATVADLGIRGAAEAIARHKEPEAEDYRDSLNDSDGWPMPPPGGHVLIDECNGGTAFIWPIGEDKGVRYYDLIAIPSGPDRPATYLKRGGAATVIAHTLAKDGFALSNCDCTVLSIPFTGADLLEDWRKADRAYEAAKFGVRA